MNHLNINQIQETLLKRIKKDNEEEYIFKKFKNYESTDEKVDLIYRLLQKYDLIPSLIEDKKCSNKSTIYREKGNKYYKAKKFRESMVWYNKSLAYSIKGSDQYALAIGNRSASLFEMELYKECLEDVKIALQYEITPQFHKKLISRSEKAQELKAKQIPYVYYYPVPAIPESSRSPTIECAADCITLKHSKTQGRHVVATRDIEIGEVVAVEKPVYHIIADEFFTHCHYCLKLCYNLKPCNNCTQVLYCSYKCIEQSSYHQYECRILKTLRVLNFDKLKLIPLRIFIDPKTSLDKIFKLPKTNVFKSESYRELFNLESNNSLRSVVDLIKRAITTAIVYHLAKMYSHFLNHIDLECAFKIIFFYHLQTGPCNFHDVSEIGRNEDGIFVNYEIGAGVYCFLSMFNHSCNPNVVRHCHGTTIAVRTIRSIKAGEECFDNYGYHFAVMKKSERIANLQQQYYFKCSCIACDQDTNLFQFLSNIPNYKDNIPPEYIGRLIRGDRNLARKLIKDLLAQLKDLENYGFVSRQICEKQEALKQCYALLGNYRYP